MYVVMYVTKQSDAECYKTKFATPAPVCLCNMIEQVKSMKIRGRLQCNNSALPNPVNGVVGRCNPINRNFCLLVREVDKKSLTDQCTSFVIRI